MTNYKINITNLYAPAPLRALKLLLSVVFGKCMTVGAGKVRVRRGLGEGRQKCCWQKTVVLLTALLMGGTAAAQTSITSLDQIDNASGHYIITQDITYNASTNHPAVATFSGILEANINPTTHMPYRISGLSAPLFTTLTGTVRNLVLEGVAISGHSGNTGAIAGEANGAARIYNVGILSGSVGGTGNTGGLVGLLSGTARVVNCYSYATITAGDNVGGLVGNNNATTTAGSINNGSLLESMRLIMEVIWENRR